MTITSNTPSQINAALLDLQRRQNNTGKVESTIVVNKPTQEQEIRFFLGEEVQDASGTHYDNYILLGDVIVIFGRRLINKTYGGWYSATDQGNGKKYWQLRTSFELPIPYGLDEGALTYATISTSSFTAFKNGAVQADEYPIWNIGSIVGQQYTIGNVPIILNYPKNIVLSCPLIMSQDYDWNCEVIMDFCIVGEIDI